MTKRTIERKSRYSPDEDARLLELAAQAALDVGSYKRFQAIGPTAGARLPNEALLSRYITELMRVGQQITPIAKAAAAGKYQGEQVPTQELADLFRNAAKEFRRELKKLKGLTPDADESIG